MRACVRVFSIYHHPFPQFLRSVCQETLVLNAVYILVSEPVLLWIYLVLLLTSFLKRQYFMQILEVL